MSAEKYDECMYAPTVRNVRRARHRAAELVAKWGYLEVAGDAGLLVSELATNAVRYGSLPGRLFRVEVTLGEGAVRLAVTDPRGERQPGEPRTADPEEESGRGLLIVASLATRWSVEPLTVGKRVWAELDP